MFSLLDLNTFGLISVCQLEEQTFLLHFAQERLNNTKINSETENPCNFAFDIKSRQVLLSCLDISCIILMLS